MARTICRERIKDYFRFDLLLYLRADGDAARNKNGHAAMRGRGGCQFKSLRLSRCVE